MTQTPSPAEPRSASLRRDLRLVDAVGVGLGAIIGAGIFVVTGVAAGVAGPAFLLGLLIAAGAAACNALSSAQLAAIYPQSGGTYEYGYRVLHPWLGFAAGWMFLASKLAAGGVVALGFASYLTALVPGLPVRPVAVGAVVLLTALNYFGIQKAGRINTVIVSVTLASLVYFVAAGLPSFRAENLTPFAPAGGSGLLRSAALLFFAYTGYARIATLGEEVRDPSRTIPRAIILSLGSSAVLYAAVAAVAVGAVGAPALAETASPLGRAAAAFAVPGAALAVSIGATTAMLGVLLSQILGISRMMLAMARREDLPQALGHIDERRGVPDRSLLWTGLIVTALAVVGKLEWIVAGASFTILVYYSIANLAALRMDPADKRYSNAIPCIGLVLCVLLALSLQPATALSGVVLLIAGFLWRWGFRRLHRRAMTDREDDETSGYGRD